MLTQTNTHYTHTVLPIDILVETLLFVDNTTLERTQTTFSYINALQNQCKWRQPTMILLEELCPGIIFQETKTYQHWFELRLELLQIVTNTVSSCIHPGIKAIYSSICLPNVRAERLVQLSFQYDLPFTFRLFLNTCGINFRAYQ